MLDRVRINQNLLVKFLSVELGGEEKAVSKGVRTKGETPGILGGDNAKSLSRSGTSWRVLLSLLQTPTSFLSSLPVILRCDASAKLSLKIRF